MKKALFLILILLMSGLIIGQVNTNKWFTYRSNGEDSRELKFIIKYPSDWISEKGDHLSVVQKFIPNEGLIGLWSAMKLENYLPILYLE